jgi:glutathione S-transferase
LEELNVPYELKEYNPLGKSPVVTDDGRTFAESGAIVEYIIDKYGKLGNTFRPAQGTDEFYRYRYWIHYSESTIMSLLLMILVFDKLPSQSPFLLRPVMR